MKAWRRTGVLWACLALSPAAGIAQSVGDASRAAALVGLARTARDQGRAEEAASYFRDADRLQAFNASLLVEYFWAAQAARIPQAVSVGERALAANPRDARVRDGLIGLAVAARQEQLANRLAEEGRSLDPAAALWARRLGESYLRQREYRRAADQFAVASTAVGSTDADRAQLAFCLELSGDKAASARAWNELSAALWSTRSDWTESRARALAPAPAPPVRRAARAPTESERVAEQLRVLAAAPCAAHPLEVLEGIGNGDAFVAAVAARPAACEDQAAWTSRAVERLIADDAFERALALARPLGSVPDSPISVREQLGVLLHWTGADADAEPLLRGVVADDLGQWRAATALVEVLRARGDTDGAWSIADRTWRGRTEAEPRIALAELAFETGRMAEALELARGLPDDDVILIGERAAAIEGAALLALGHPAEARRVLEPLVPTQNSAILPWIDAIAVTDGLSAGLQAADRLPVRAHPAWVDLNARRAVWQARLGHRQEAERWLREVEAVYPLRGLLTRAEMALAAGRPIDAEATLREVLATTPRDVRALDGLSTALAEQGRWTEALAVLAELRTRRPSETRWLIRDAEWRYRQSPSEGTLQALERVVADHSSPDAASALARAYFAAGEFERAATTLSAASSLAEYDKVLLARSLRSLGRPNDALGALSGLGMGAPLDALLLRAELESAVHGQTAADRLFRELTSRPDAEAEWFLAWADLQTTSAGVTRVLEDGSRRFPGDAGIHERLAVSAWAQGDRELAARAARATLAADSSRTSAWFVAIEVAGTAGDRETSLPALLDRFEARFGPDTEARVGMAEMLAGLSRSADDPAAERALGWMNDVLARNANAAPAAVARARLLLAQGRTAQALAAVDTIVAANPELSAALKLRAELLATAGRYAESVSAYDTYLAEAPDDFQARRQQARVEGWRGDYDASRQRYARLREREPQADVIAAEADAKQSYYGGRWNEAASRYDRWLALDPNDVEAQLERAQLYDRLGEPVHAVERFRAVTSTATPNDVAATAAERIDRRRRASVDLFAAGNSADAAARQQLLDLVDSGAGVSDDLGLGYGVRARLFGGPSFAQGADDRWYGSHVGTEMSARLAPSLRATGTVAYRKLDGMEGAWFGDLGVAWRVGSRLRTAVGAERALVLENQTTLTSGLHGVGPTASVRWTPNTDFMLDANAGQLSLSDGNERRTLRATVSQRVLRGVSEIRVTGIVDGLGFNESRSTYFTPSSFWRFDAGAEWRGWLAMPRFFGDRERWLSAGYFFGVDDRSVRYHTMRAGLSYELTGGVAVVVDARATRSPVYNAGRVSIGLRLKQVAIPEP